MAPAPAESPQPQRARRARRRLLGDLLIRDGLITRAQLDAALHAQDKLDAYAPLGYLLVDQGVITPDQLAVVLDKYESRLGDILVETDAITEEQLETALQQQRKTGLRLGDVLLRLNLVTEERMKEALCKQLRIALVDLDQVALDRGIAQLVNRRYAQQRRVIPIARHGNRITLAMDDPTDVEAIEELESSTGCRIEVVTSTSAAFDRALVRAYEARAEPEGTPTEPRPEPRIEPSAGVAGSRPAPGELEALRRELEAATRALDEVRERYAALLRDRQEVTDRLEAVLRRLKT